jgi:hypothetical protein
VAIDAAEYAAMPRMGIALRQRMTCMMSLAAAVLGVLTAQIS